jgi:GNAT superfamily N-acetyltransferase
MLRIRPAAPDDARTILALIRELAVYERAPDAVVATEADIARDGFGPHPRFRCDLAEWDSAPAGFCLYFFNWSTWLGKPGLYLEDLFVRPALRGRGIGKALLVHLARVAVREGCGRFSWQVLDWNEPALRFYESLGAQRLSEWLTLRVEGEALGRMAAIETIADPEVR